MDFENIFTKLKRPSRVEYIQKSGQENTFIIKPLERGMGHTIANGIRRVLLSSLEGFSVLMVKFNKANNIYQNIPGVYQDTLEICASLKNVAFWSNDSNFKTKKISFNIKGKKSFYAKDIVNSQDDLEVGNPDLLLFETEKDADFSFDLYITKGFGYVESHVTDKLLGSNVGEIVLDADFTPIDNVSFDISNVTIEGISSYEKIELTIQTKGVGSPKLFLGHAVSILKEYYSSFDIIKEIKDFTEVVQETDEDKVVEEDIFIEEKSVYKIKGMNIQTFYFLYKNKLNNKNDVLSQPEDNLRKMPNSTDEIIDIIKEKIIKEN